MISQSLVMSSTCRSFSSQNTDALGISASKMRRICRRTLAFRMQPRAVSSRWRGDCRTTGCREPGDCVSVVFMCFGRRVSDPDRSAACRSKLPLLVHIQRRRSEFAPDLIKPGAQPAEGDGELAVPMPFGVAEAPCHYSNPHDLLRRHPGG